MTHFRTWCSKQCKRHASSVSIFAVLAVLLLAGTVEHYGLVPLQGSATPTYGVLPPANTGRRVSIKSSARSKSSRVPNRLANRSAVSSLHAGPASSISSAATASQSKSVASATSITSASSSTKSIAKACEGNECKAKMLATATGDVSCFYDENCESKLGFLCTESVHLCRSIAVAEWVMYSLMPECLVADSVDCQSARTFFLNPAPAAAVKNCNNSLVCRELLSTFRRGDFSCRRQETCLNALEAIVSTPTCESMAWCKNLKEIDTLYTAKASECSGKSEADCAKQIGVTALAKDKPRFEPCMRDADCRQELEEIFSGLTGVDIRYPRPNPEPACFLWNECKYEFTLHKDWFCENKDSYADICQRYTDIWQFLTVTSPSCVQSGESRYCQQSLKNLRE
jgi:hypothetical protein